MHSALIRQRSVNQGRSSYSPAELFHPQRQLSDAEKHFLSSTNDDSIRAQGAIAQLHYQLLVDLSRLKFTETCQK
eukprot:2363202-Amphidinium_carterae.1